MAPGSVLCLNSTCFCNADHDTRKIYLILEAPDDFLCIRFPSSLFRIKITAIRNFANSQSGESRKN